MQKFSFTTIVMSDVPQGPTSLVNSRVRPIVVNPALNYNHHNNNYMIAPTLTYPVLVQNTGPSYQLFKFPSPIQQVPVQRIQSVCDLYSSKLYRYPINPTTSSVLHANCTGSKNSTISYVRYPFCENNQKITHHSNWNGAIISDNHLLETVYPSPVNIGSLPHIPPIMEELTVTSLSPCSDLCTDEFDKMKDHETLNTISYSPEVQTTAREGLQRLPFEDFTTSPDNYIYPSNSLPSFSSCSSCSSCPSISSSNSPPRDLATFIESPLLFSLPPPSPISPKSSPLSQQKSFSLTISIPFSKAVPQCLTSSLPPSLSPISSLTISIPIKVWLKARKRRRKNSHHNTLYCSSSKLDTQIQKDMITIDDCVANRNILSQDLNSALSNNDTNSSAMYTSTEEKNKVLKKLEEIFQDSPLLSEKDAANIKSFLTGKTIHLPKPLMRYALRQVISSEGVVQYACIELDVQNKQWRGIKIDANSISIHNNHI